LPVGGIKEKILAAHRAGIRRVCLPERNRRDLIEIKDEIKSEMQFHFVSNIAEIPDLIFLEPELLERRVEAAKQRTTVHENLEPTT
jgi:ATP-dependent Lon protease